MPRPLAWRLVSFARPLLPFPFAAPPCVCFPCCRAPSLPPFPRLFFHHRATACSPQRGRAAYLRAARSAPPLQSLASDGPPSSLPQSSQPLHPPGVHLAVRLPVLSSHGCRRRCCCRRHQSIQAALATTVTRCGSSRPSPSADLTSRPVAAGLYTLLPSPAAPFSSSFPLILPPPTTCNIDNKKTAAIIRR